MVTGEQLARAPRAVKYGEADATASGVTIAEGYSVIERLLAHPA
jgi:hypothetical protein